MKKKNKAMVGNYAYIIGVILAIVLGLVSAQLPADALGWLTSLLVLAGLFVGFINVTGKQTKDFLMVSTILVIVSYLGGATSNLTSIYYIGPYMSAIFAYMMAFIVPATVVIGLKDLLALAKA